MKKNNTYLLLIIQALLTILMLFVESTTLYIALALFLIIDIAVFISLFSRRWRALELYVFLTLFVSIIYLLFLFYMKGDLLMILAIGQVILFLLSAIISYERAPRKKLPQPIKPQAYDDYDESPDIEMPPKKAEKPVVVGDTPLETYDFDELGRELDMIDKQERLSRRENAKMRARALAYELEREASELKRAENYIRKKQSEEESVEIANEAKAMEKAAKQASIVENALKQADVKRQAEELESAEKQAKEIEFLNKQQKLNEQAIDLVRAQQEINDASAIRNRKKKTAKKASKSVKSASKTSKKTSEKLQEMVFATKSGNNFHNPGCIAIKRIPKKNLVTFNSRKDALKKGYKPCNVCKP